MEKWRILVVLAGVGMITLDNANATCNDVTPCSVTRDGHWGCWGPWGGCSKSCGVGTRTRTRSCTNPTRAGSGSAFCNGNSLQSERCITQKFDPVRTNKRSTTNRHWFSSPSLKSCKEACLIQYSSCKALEYTKSTRTCLLMFTLVDGTPPPINSSTEFYMVRCSNPPTPTPPTPAGTFTDGCQNSGRCYSACGESKYVKQTISGSEVTLRYIWFDLSTLNTRSFPGATKVTLHAQTVILNQRLTLPYHLVIVARQIYLSGQWSFRYQNTAVDQCYREDVFVDCSNNHKLQLISLYGGGGRVDIYGQEVHGSFSACRSRDRIVTNPKYDVIALTLAATCAQEMAMSSSSTITNAAKNVLSYLVHISKDTAGFTNTHEALSLASLASATSDMINTRLNYNLRFVPVLSQASFQRQLSLYSGLFRAYKDHYSNAFLTSRTTSQKLTDLKATLDEYQQALSLQTQRVQFAQQRFQEVGSTLESVGKAFENSSSKLNEKRSSLEDGMQTYIDREATKAAAGFLSIVGDVISAVGGIKSATTGGNRQEIDKTEMMLSVTQLVSGVNDLADMILDCYLLVLAIATIADAANKIHNVASTQAVPPDASAILDDIEQAATVRIRMVVWDTVKNKGDAYLSQDPLPDVQGASDYQLALADLCTWGKGMSELLIDYAELGRIYTIEVMAKQAAQDNYNRMQAQYNTAQSTQQVSAALLNEASKEVVEVHLAAARMIGHFCQSYFYFMFSECDSSIRIKNSDSLNDVYNKLHTASTKSIEDLSKFGTTGAPVAVNGHFVIRDTVTNYAQCKDVADCPLSTIKARKKLMFSIDFDAPYLRGYDRFRFQEMRIFFPGIRFTQGYSMLTVYVHKLPTVYDKYNGQSYAFQTVGREHMYTFDYQNNQTIDYACVHTSINSAVYHLTPFGNWSLEVDDPYLEADLANVNSIEVYFLGSAIPRGTAPPSNPNVIFGPHGQTFSPVCGSGSNMRFKRRSLLPSVEENVASRSK